MHNVFHPVIDIIGEGWVDKQHALDIFELTVGDSLEEVINLLFCLVALINHVVVA